MTNVNFSSGGITAHVRGSTKQRDGGIRAAVDFRQGDRVIFSHNACWTDAVERAAVAEQLAKLTQIDAQELANDLLLMEGALANESGSQEQTRAINTPAEAEWPEPPGAVAFAGLAGRIVDAIEPHTEADPTAVLINLIVAFGNCVGAGPHFMVGATRHDLHLFAALVGDTAKARKGDSWSPVRFLFRRAALEWADERIVSGLSTGEGLIWQVRDPIEKYEAIKEKGKVVGHEWVTVDEGVSDKRLMVIEAELARLLQSMSRTGNTLSAVIRDAWDRGNLNILTKTNAARATEAHISIIGHITHEELRRELNDVEVANGFANRIIWTAVRRSKFLPEPEPLVGPQVDALANELQDTLVCAQGFGEMRRDAQARELWAQVYHDLSDAKPGLAGAIVARGEAQTMRLAAIYALFDRSQVICARHLASALELWAYAERSAAYIWSDQLGDPIADTIAQALLNNGKLSRTEISNLFGRHANATQINTALQRLLSSGRARTYSDPSGGRPVEYWEPAA